MSVSLNKEELTLNKFISRDKFSTWIEQDVLVPDIKPDVMKIIRVEAIPFIENSEITDGTIKVSGTITYYILYRSMDGGAITGITMEYPFVQNINTSLAKSNMQFDVDAVAKNTIYSIPNERKILLKTEILFKFSVMDTVVVPIAIGFDVGKDIEYKTKEELFNNVISTKKETIAVNEEVIIPDDIGPINDIIKVGTTIKNTDYKVSYNKILVKGELQLQILYLKGEQTNAVGTYNLTIPFAGMIEFDNIADNYKFDIKYSLQNLQIILNGEENGTLTVDGAILARGVMYEERSIIHIADFYSTNKDLIYDYADIAVIKNKTKLDKDITIKERIGQLEEGSQILQYQIDTNSLITMVSGGNLYISGNVKIPVVYQNSITGMVDSKTFEVPVENSFTIGKDIGESNVVVSLEVFKDDIYLSSGNVEANIILRANIEIENVGNITTIQEVSEQEIDVNNFESMYIYIVKKGDTLWDIAKKYKTTVSKIANVNNINDESNIQIGQKLLLIR
ncbi:MAG: DUF3794 domain-containing protein [Clostridia bacterium]|nr:DUF3794 domain-containing protein [Clostridia bacterium]